MAITAIESDIYTLISKIDECNSLFSDLGILHPFSASDDRSWAAEETQNPLLCNVEDKTKLCAIYMHGSFANLIVPGDKEEVALAIFAIDDRECHVFIAYNGQSFSKVKQHLSTIWNLLLEVRRSDNIDSKVNIIRKLRRVCYEYCKYRVEMYRDKANQLNVDSFFNEILKENSPYVADESWRCQVYLSPPVISRDELEYVKGFHSIDQAVGDALETGNSTTLATLVNELQKALEDGRLVRSDQSFAVDSSFFFRCGSIGADLLTIMPGGGSRATAILDLWDDLFSIEQAVSNILDLAFSKKMSRILDFKLRVTFIDRGDHGRRLDYNLTNEELVREVLENDDAHEILHARPPSKIKKRHMPSGIVYPHPECCLLAFIIGNGLSPTFPYIGTSESSCTACRLLFNACNWRSRQSIYIRGGRNGGKACFPWVFPSGIERSVCQTLFDMAAEELQFLGLELVKKYHR